MSILIFSYVPSEKKMVESAGHVIVVLIFIWDGSQKL